jgi:uncharacterized sporulation protein YeaH/YhbH (DUF444 family)
MHLIVDRRLNGRNKSAVNRERFMRRYKERIRDAVKGMVGERSIADMDKGGDVHIPARDISEPSFRHGPGGDREMVHPGNREFVAGDTIPRNSGASSGGGGDRGEPGQGSVEDAFVFTLSREEFMNIFFDDLELPRMARTVMGQVEQHRWVRSGYVKDGAPCNLSVTRTLQAALARRIALSGAASEQVRNARDALDEAQAEGAPDEELAGLQAELLIHESRGQRLPFLDEVDLRYRHHVAVPRPVARAVMFCLMDVSSSMDEFRKDLAKRFFTLLYLFLSRKYEHVELVFIRHTEDAEEVDEQTFFTDTHSGGTVVLSALELAHGIATQRYPTDSWNLYFAQASDGDSFGADAGKSARFLEEKLLPMARHYAYIEVNEFDFPRMSSLWAGYETLSRPHFAMRRVGQRADIYPVFRDLFARENAQ